MRNPMSETLGRDSEELYLIPSGREAIVPENMSGIRCGLEDKLVVSKRISAKVDGEHEMLRVKPDGNRGAIVHDKKVELWGREFFISIKGIGTRMAMFDDSIPTFHELTYTSEPYFTSEAWFGENPWGAMSRQGCLEDRGITEMANEDGINGFHICPMVRATSLPPWLMEEARKHFWYRRLDRPGDYYQQVRLMPSSIRLFYQSKATLGKETQLVLREFDIKDTQGLDLFIERYIGSGVAALTLIPRTIKEDDVGFIALDFTDVWLDKDSVIAPDGTIYFADIEGLEWIHLKDARDAQKMMIKQVDRNYYEFMYGLDCLLKVREVMAGNMLSREALRNGLATRFELALQGDRFTELRKTSDSLFLKLLANGDIMEGAEVKILDFN